MSDLTREQLREALIDAGLNAPTSLRKDELVALYEENNLGAAGGNLIAVSDDDDHEVSFGGKRKAASKRASQSSRRSNANMANSSSLTEANSLLVDGRDVADLNDEELFRELKAFGVDVGPIVESTRTLYRKKLAILLRGENSGSGGQNGSHSNGLGAFSADEETEDDEQPAAVVSPVSPVSANTSRRSRAAKDSTPKKMDVTEVVTDIRKRFNSSFESPEKGSRFTPTPRRSIHTYKVTETSKQTMIKSKDGNVSHDYVYSKQTSEDIGRDFSVVERIFVSALKYLPKLFLLLVVATVVVYVYVNHGDFLSSNLIGYFPKSIEEVSSAEGATQAAREQPAHVEQGSIGDV